MSRLPFTRYLEVRLYLRQVWFEKLMAYGWLSSREQQSLHDYFKPSKDLDEIDLRQIWQESHNSTLPSRAGKAAARLNRLHGSPHTSRSKKRRVVVAAVRRPQINVELLVQAILLHVEEIQAANRQEFG